MIFETVTKFTGDLCVHADETELTAIKPTHLCNLDYLDPHLIMLQWYTSIFLFLFLKTSMRGF